MAAMMRRVADFRKTTGSRPDVAHFRRNAPKIYYFGT
jgi:hypothetical protein